MDDKLMELIRELFKAVMTARQDIADLKAEIELLKNPPKKPRGRKKKEVIDDVPSLTKEAATPTESARGEDLAPASTPASDPPFDIAAAPEHTSAAAASPLSEHVPEPAVAPEPAPDPAVTFPSQSAEAAPQNEAAFKSDASDLIARANELLAKGLQL